MIDIAKIYYHPKQANISPPPPHYLQGGVKYYPLKNFKMAICLIVTLHIVYSVLTFLH